MHLPKLALIYPPISEAHISMRDSGLTPPLHLLALAAAVTAETLILDGNHLSVDEIIRKIEEFEPDIIGMNVDLTNYANAIVIANSTRARIILGGNYAAFLADQILANQSRIEAVCYNDGEEALAGFIAGNLRASNLIHRGGKNTVKLLDIKELPTPAYDLLDMEEYFRRQREIFGEGFKMMQFYGQKGCLNAPHCTFCGRYEDGMRLRDPMLYAAEVKHYVNKYQLTEVWDRSDSYLQSGKWFSTVFSQLKELQVTFKTYARADQLIDRNIAMMRQMNFRMVYIGYEAGDDEVLRKMNKNETTAQYLDATKRVLDAGIDIDASFIIGLPGENKATLDNQIKFVEKLAEMGLRKIKVNRVLVLPGTPLYTTVCQNFPEIRKQDILDNSNMQRKLYSTYDLKEFGSVDAFIGAINTAAATMVETITKAGGCAEGYGYGKATWNGTQAAR